MPAKSEKQKKFMNVVRLYKQGKIKNVGDKVKKAASSMETKDVNDFAFTKGNLPKEAPKKKDNLNFELFAEENIKNDIWSIINEETFVPEWLAEIPLSIRYEILCGSTLEEICGKETDPLVEEAYRKIEVIKAARPLSQFPMGKAKRWPGEKGASSGHGTFITGEKDYIKEQGKEPGQSIFSMRDYIKKVPYEKNKELEDSLEETETNTPYEKEKRDNPRGPRSIDILRRSSRSLKNDIKQNIQESLKKYGVIK